MKKTKISCMLLMLILLIGCSNKDIDPDVIRLPAEHETPTIDGLKMNVYVEKKEFNLHEPINIYTMIRNMSDNIKKYSFMSYNSNGDPKLYYSVLNEKGEPIEEFPFNPHLSFDKDEDKLIEVDYSLNPSAIIMYKKDIQSLVQKPGKYQIIVRLIAFSESGILTSNKIEFEVVE